MPVKNTEQYLPTCLDSICSQTETDWELIAIDDNSTDTSYQILQEYAQEDARIKVFQNPNSGIITALRLAYSKSTGQLITRMDSDDIMPTVKLHTLKSILLEHQQGHLATGFVEYFSDKPLGDGYRRYQDWLNHLCKTESHFQEIYKECVIPSPCWMAFREDFERCDALNPNDYPEDYDLCFRFYEHGLKPIASQAVLHLWRDYSTRTSRTDEHYADNRFLTMKLRYFLKLDYDSARPLVLWGAGKKGKMIARSLKEKGVPFHWVCNNEKKLGRDIYGVILEKTAIVQLLVEPQVIITVANREEQIVIKNELEGKDGYFFV